MSEMNNEIFEDLKDAYVLDALPEEERRAFEDYLAAHPERQAEIDELGAVAGLLAFAPPEQEPSPQLRSGIMEIVGSEASPMRARRESALARFWGSLGARGLALGAAALLVVGLLSWNLLLQGQVGDLQGEVQNSQDQVKDLKGQVELAGSWASQGADAEVAYIGQDQLILVAKNMPSVPDNRTCQIWVIKGDSPPSPSGLFQPDGNMTATPITNSVEKADTIAITVEPAGGSDQPTTEPVLQAKL
jgi:anti-sigma-K factor RskA